MRTGYLHRCAVALSAAALALIATGCSTDGASPDLEPTATVPAAVCSENVIAEVIGTDVNETYPGATFVSIESFECIDGWVYARALVDTSGVVVPTSFFLRDEASTWAPVSIKEICADTEDSSRAPDPIYLAACGSPE